VFSFTNFISVGKVLPLRVGLFYISFKAFVILERNVVLTEVAKGAFFLTLYFPKLYPEDVFSTVNQRDNVL
jgi:hypothetical protein